MDINHSQSSIKNFLNTFFEEIFNFDKMIWFIDGFSSDLLNLHQNAIFLILPNVKILSLLARVKMKRAELFSENGASTRVFWSLRELWNSVSSWSDSFTFIYFRRRVFLKKVLSFQIFSALFFKKQCSVFKFSARCFKIFSALKLKKLLFLG